MTKKILETDLEDPGGTAIEVWGLLSRPPMIGFMKDMGLFPLELNVKGMINQISKKS